MNGGSWKIIVKLRYDFQKLNTNLPLLFKRKIGNGNNTLFWDDLWVGESKLRDDFPILYASETLKIT